MLIVAFLFFLIYITSKSNEYKWQERHYLLSDRVYFGTHNYKEHDINIDLVIDDKNISEMILMLLNSSHEKKNIPTQYNDNISLDIYT